MRKTRLSSTQTTTAIERIESVNAWVHGGSSVKNSEYTRRLSANSSEMPTMNVLRIVTGRDITIWIPPISMEAPLKTSAAPMMGNGSASSAAPTFGTHDSITNQLAIA